MRDPTDDGNIEQDQSGRCDSGQPQPFAAAGMQDLNSCDATHQHQRHGRREISDGLGGQQRSIRTSETATLPPTSTMPKPPRSSPPMSGPISGDFGTSHPCCNDGPMNRSKAGADQRAKSHSADFCSSIWPKPRLARFRTGWPPSFAGRSATAGWRSAAGSQQVACWPLSFKSPAVWSPRPTSDSVRTGRSSAAAERARS